MYRSLAEAAANCARNIATGFGSIPHTSPGSSPVLTPQATKPDALDVGLEGRVAELRHNLVDSACAARVRAACAIGEIGPAAKAAVPELIAALEDRDWVVRMAVITALGEIGEYASPAVPMLTEMLEKEDTRTSCIIALGRIGPEAREAAPVLEMFKKSADPFIRWCAERALEAIFCETAEPPALARSRRPVLRKSAKTATR